MALNSFDCFAVFVFNRFCIAKQKNKVSAFSMTVLSFPTEFLLQARMIIETIKLHISAFD